MKAWNSGEQQVAHYFYDASGSITSGGTAQLVLPDHSWCGRSHLFFQNTSVETMTVEIGSARATATLTNGVVTSVSVTNAGFNFTIPPQVRFDGGGRPGGNTKYTGLAAPGGPAPSNRATGHAVLTAGAVSSIVIENGGSDYVVAPLVFLYNSILDPNGCALPTSSVGISLTPGGSIYYNGTVCPTEAMSVYCGTTGATFVCKFMT